MEEEKLAKSIAERMKARSEKTKKSNSYTQSGEEESSDSSAETESEEESSESDDVPDIPTHFSPQSIEALSNKQYGLTFA